VGRGTEGDGVGSWNYNGRIIAAEYGDTGVKAGVPLAAYDHFISSLPHSISKPTLSAEGVLRYPNIGFSQIMANRLILELRFFLIWMKAGLGNLKYSSCQKIFFTTERDSINFDELIYM
jgi:hypothetical protein